MISKGLIGSEALFAYSVEKEQRKIQSREANYTQEQQKTMAKIWKSEIDTIVTITMQKIKPLIERVEILEGITVDTSWKHEQLLLYGKFYKERMDVFLDLQDKISSIKQS